MNDTTCKDCPHFHQHYVLDDSRCIAIHCGHCYNPRLKHKHPDAPVCTRFQPSSRAPSLPDRDEVIHFLTKDLLQYILSLPLPPEIHTKPEK